MFVNERVPLCLLLEDNLNIVEEIHSLVHVVAKGSIYAWCYYARKSSRFTLRWHPNYIFLQHFLSRSILMWGLWIKWELTDGLCVGVDYVLWQDFMLISAMEERWNHMLITVDISLHRHGSSDAIEHGEN